MQEHPANGAWNHRQGINLKTTDIHARTSCRRSMKSQTRYQSQNDWYPCKNILPTSATLFLNY